MSHPFASRIRWWSRANAPAGSVFQKIRADARMNWSWNCRWWKDRFHPCRSSASRAARHSAIRRNPLLSRPFSVNPMCRWIAVSFERFRVSSYRRLSAANSYASYSPCILTGGNKRALSIYVRSPPRSHCMEANLAHLLVVVASSVSAVAPPAQCAVEDCAPMDALIPKNAAFYPLAAAVLTLALLGGPTVLVPYRQQNRGIASLLAFLLQAGLQTLACDFLKAAPTLQYAVAVHGAVHLLAAFPCGPHLVGGRLWWALRHAASLLLCLVVAYRGPPLSLVGGHAACAYRAHMLGMFVPTVIQAALDVVAIPVGDWPA